MDAQRFQKCSQSVKKGVVVPLLCISMTNNVISYKKNNKKHSKNKFADFTMKYGLPSSEITKNSTKNRSL